MNQKTWIFSALLAISVLLVIPQTISTDAQESILLFENPMISTPSNDYEISSDFEIRILRDGDLVRVSGTTVDGNPYYVYQQMINDVPTINGKIFIDNNPVEVFHRNIIPAQVMDEVEEVIDEMKQEVEQKNLKVLVDTPINTQHGQNFRFTVTVYDADVNPNPKFFSKTDGLLKEIPISATLTDKNGDVLTTFEGVTDNLGKFEGAYYWEFSDIVGNYELSLDVNNGNYLENFGTNYLGYIPPSDSN